MIMWCGRVEWLLLEVKSLGKYKSQGAPNISSVSSTSVGGRGAQVSTLQKGLISVRQYSHHDTLPEAQYSTWKDAIVKWKQLHEAVSIHWGIPLFGFHQIQIGPKWRQKTSILESWANIASCHCDYKSPQMYIATNLETSFLTSNIIIDSSSIYIYIHKLYNRHLVLLRTSYEPRLLRGKSSRRPSGKVAAF